MCTALRRYIDEHHGGKQSAFADAAGIGRPELSRYVNGHAIPHRANMVKIVRASGGAVKPADFFADVEAEAITEAEA